MHTYYEVKDMLKRELENLTRRGDITDKSLEEIDMLLHSIKNACKIIMYEEYADDDGYSYRDGYSNARGRRGNVKRDSMGRYAREGGYSYEGGYSNEGDYSNRRGGRYSREGGYSYDGGHEDKMQMLRELMNESTSEEEKDMIKRLMQHMEK